LSKRLSILLGLIVVPGVTFGIIYFTQCSKEDTEKNQAIKKEEAPQEAPKEGFLAPQFALNDLSGNLVRLGDFKGKVVLLNFWASWCAPCRREIPSLERLYEMRKDRGFEIVAVNSERASASQIASFADANRMSFPILLNPQGDVSGNYWVRAIPTSFLLDKKGVIRWKIVGGREWDGPDVLTTIDQLLGE